VGKEVEKKSFLRGVTWAFLGNALSFLFSFAGSVIIARTLGPEGKGLYSLLILLPSSVFIIGKLGIPDAIVYFFGGKKLSASRAYRTSVRVYFILLLFSMVLYGASVFILKKSLFRDVGSSLIILAALLVPVELFRKQFSAFLKAELRMKDISMIQVGIAILFVFLLLPLAFSPKPNVGWALGSRILANFAGSLWVFFLVRGLIRKTQVESGPEENRNWVRTFLGYGTVNQIGILLLFFILKADQFMIKYFLGSRDLGFYTVSVGLAQNIWLVSASVSAVLLPTLSRLYGQEKARVASRVLRTTMLAVLPLSLLLLLFASPIIRFFYSQRFSPSIVPFRILMVATYVFTFRNLLDEYFRSMGLLKVNILTHGTALALNILLNLFWIPAYGIRGAALASLVSYSLDAVMGGFFFLKSGGLRAGEVFGFNGKDLALLLNGVFRRGGAT